MMIRGLILALVLQILIVMPARAEADLEDPETIVKQAFAATPADRLRAADFANEARLRIQTDLKQRGAIRYGPAVKLWCAAVLYAPTPESLSECASARFGVIAKLRNPQPSREDARLAQAQESLGLIRAAQEIADTIPDLEPDVRKRLSADAECLEKIIRKDADLGICTPPYVAE